VKPNLSAEGNGSRGDTVGVNGVGAGGFHIVGALEGHGDGMRVGVMGAAVGREGARVGEWLGAGVGCAEGGGG
jgi:hypothetical protein